MGEGGGRREGGQADTRSQPGAHIQSRKQRGRTIKVTYGAHEKFKGGKGA